MWFSGSYRLTGICWNAILACAAALLLSQCSQHWNVVRNGAAHRTIAVFGDSLATGVGASTPDNGFVNLLFNNVRQADPDAQIANFAVGGSTVSDVLDSASVQAGRTAEPTDVWICVGGNDVTHGTPTEQFASTEHALIAALRRSWPKAHIVVFGVPDVSRSPSLPGSTKILFHNDASLDNDAARDAAKSGEADFVDLFWFSDSKLDISQDFAADEFHPNDRGYAAIAAYALKDGVLR